MKTLHRKIEAMIGLVLLALIAVSCLPETQSMGGAGQTLVKITPEEFSMVALNPVSTPQTMTLFEVRRDVPSSDVLNNTTTTVVIEFDADGSILTAYNDDNGTEFEPLDVSLHSTTPALGADNKITLEFAKGEYVKAVLINVPNAFDFDFSKTYALAYEITSVSGEGVLSQASSTEIVAQVLAKNKYDGKYEITAVSPMLDVLSADLVGWYPFTYELETTGEHSCTCLLTDPGYFNYYHPIYVISGDYISAYGGLGLELVFDPSGNGDVVEIRNPWGNPPANTRMPVLDPSGVNNWDEDTKVMQLKYWMIQPSLVPDPPSIRTYFDEIWTYKGPR